MFDVHLMILIIYLIWNQFNVIRTGYVMPQRDLEGCRRRSELASRKLILESRHRIDSRARIYDHSLKLMCKGATSFFMQEF